MRGEDITIASAQQAGGNLTEWVEDLYGSIRMVNNWVWHGGSVLMG